MPNDAANLNAPGTILDGCMTREDAARELRCHPRTLARYEAEPDGLPSLVLAGRVYYRIDDLRRFIERRVRQRNPVRKVAR